MFSFHSVPSVVVEEKTPSQPNDILFCFFVFLLIIKSIWGENESEVLCYTILPLPLLHFISIKGKQLQSPPVTFKQKEWGRVQEGEERHIPQIQHEDKSVQQLHVLPEVLEFCLKNQSFKCAQLTNTQKSRCSYCPTWAGGFLTDSRSSVREQNWCGLEMNYEWWHPWVGSFEPSGLDCVRWMWMLCLMRECDELFSSTVIGSASVSACLPVIDWSGW